MAAYVADAYNAALPTTADIAGHADKEIRAIKERLNSQIGLGTVLNVGSRLATTETNVTTQGQSIASIGTRLSTAEGTITTQGQTIASQGSAISSNTQAINGLSSTVSSQGQTLTSYGTRIGNAETVINGHTASINNLTPRMGTAETNITNLSNWSTGAQNTLNQLWGRGQIVGITSAPANSWGNEGDLLVWYV